MWSERSIGYVKNHFAPFLGFVVFESGRLSAERKKREKRGGVEVNLPVLYVCKHCEIAGVSCCVELNESHKIRHVMDSGERIT